MNEPTRLLSTPESELERALLEAGRSYTASSSTRAKTLLALGLTAVVPSVAPAAAATGKTFTKAALFKLAGSVLLVGAVALPVWRYLGHHPNSTPITQRPVAAAAAPVLTAVPAEVPAAPADAAPAEISATGGARVEAAEPPTSIVSRSGRGTRSELKPTSAPPLTAELAALDSARTSLSHGDPAGALAALDGYAHDFPRGRLKLEAEVLRIGALAKSGQTDAARKRAEVFLRLHPDSVLASRVRSYAGL
jgi:hypothetical protein